MAEAVGHADGDLDPVVERLEPRARIAQLDGPEDVRSAPPILFASSTISGMRECEARNTQCLNSPLACSSGCLSRVLNSSLSCHER